MRDIAHARGTASTGQGPSPPSPTPRWSVPHDAAVPSVTSPPDGAPRCPGRPPPLGPAFCLLAGGGRPCPACAQTPTLSGWTGLPLAPRITAGQRPAGGPCDLPAPNVAEATRAGMRNHTSTYASHLARNHRLTGLRPPAPDTAPAMAEPDPRGYLSNLGGLPPLRPAAQRRWGSRSAGPADHRPA